MSAARPGTMGTGRLEAFSDGVFAIAVTLLVLDLRLDPGLPRGELAHALGTMWPAYAAYFVSFLTIGIIWLNHHALFERVVSADRGLLTVNLLLLLFVSVIPFPTSLLARFLRSGSDEHVAAAVYSGTLLAMGMTFFCTFLLARARGHVGEHLTPRMGRFLLIRNGVGQLGYVVAVALAFVSAPASLALCGVVAVYYLVPESVLGMPE